MKKIFVSLFVLPCLLFCTVSVSGQNDVYHPWPKEIRDVFVSECITSISGVGVNEQVKRDYCNCSLQKLEEKYPDASVMEDVEDEKIAEEIEPCIKDFVEEVKKLKKVEQTEHTEWTEGVRNTFLEECRINAGKSITDKNLVDRYCKCSLLELEAAYPDPVKMENVSEDQLLEIINPCIEALTKELGGE